MSLIKMHGYVALYNSFAIIIKRKRRRRKE